MDIEDDVMALADVAEALANDLNRGLFSFVHPPVQDAPFAAWNESDFVAFCNIAEFVNIMDYIDFPREIAEMLGLVPDLLRESFRLPAPDRPCTWAW